MTILVFGKTGQVAQELQRQAEVLALGRAEVDLRHPHAISAAMETHRPNAVINAAAYTAVDRAETEPVLAEAVNARAPGIMAQLCAKRGIPFLHISTDYVFSGNGPRPWRETDPVAPQNAYGRSKLAGEVAVRRAGGRHVILRTSWVFSAHGGNFVKTMLRLAETRPEVAVVADQLGGPTPAADIAATLLTLTQAMLAGREGGTYHYAGYPHVSWADFARVIFAAAGRRVLVTDITSATYPTPAARPLNSRLDCAKLRADFGITPPDWNAGLAAVLNELDLT